MHYYYFVGEERRPASEVPEEDTVSSAEIAEFLHMDDTLVRKDLAAIGVRGYPRVGFKVDEVLTAIREVLGFEQTHRAVIVGAGRMGGALANYTDFAKYGLVVMAVFDNDPAKLGKTLGGAVIQSLDNLESTIARLGVRLAILTVPVDPAQSIADRLVVAGVQAIWNFAPTRLVAPPHVVVRHEHISVGLAELAYHLRRLGDAS
jgi:redox-sensing transcriptional repressor